MQVWIYVHVTLELCVLCAQLKENPQNNDETLKKSKQEEYPTNQQLMLFSVTEKNGSRTANRGSVCVSLWFSRERQVTGVSVVQKMLEIQLSKAVAFYNPTVLSYNFEEDKHLCATFYNRVMFVCLLILKSIVLSQVFLPF